MLNKIVLDHYPAVRNPDGPAFNPPLQRFRALPVHGVILWECPWIIDPRGALTELWREDCVLRSDTDGRKVEQAYISLTRPNTVKGWHLHSTSNGDCGADAQKDRFVVLSGRIRLGFVDLRGYNGKATAAVGNACHPTRYTQTTGFPSAEVELDSSLGCWRVDIPPGVAHGWIALGSEDARVLNLVSHSYDGQQERRCDPHGPVAPGLPPWDWRASRDG